MVTLDMQMKSERMETSKQSKSSNGRGVVIDGIAHQVTCPKFEKGCRGPTYNQGFKRYLCVDGLHPLCATANPYICDHPKDKLWQRVKDYSKQAKILEEMRLEIQEAGANYA